MGIKGHLNSTNPNISLVERTNGYESFFFVSNFDEVDQTGIIYEDDIPLFDGEEVHLPPRSGAIFIRNMELSNGLIIDFATVELTQLENTDDLVFLTVKPIGAKGTLKINANGFWKTEHGTLNGNTILVKDITAEKTIKFKRIKQE
jgi:beta-galactosidase